MVKQKLTVSDFKKDRLPLSEEEHFKDLRKVEEIESDKIPTKHDESKIKKDDMRNSVFTDLRKSSKEETKQTIKINKKKYKKIKKFCIDKEITFQDFIIKLIDDFFSKDRDEDA